MMTHLIMRASLKTESYWDDITVAANIALNLEREIGSYCWYRIVNIPKPKKGVYWFANHDDLPVRDSYMEIVIENGTKDQSEGLTGLGFNTSYYPHKFNKRKGRTKYKRLRLTEDGKLRHI